MTSFDVLKKSQNVHQSYLLEASAGTGKTFSIENVVARLLIEEPACLLEEILALTFTKAAAQDLKTRIFSSLQKTAAFLEAGSMHAPDYLQPFFASEEALLKAKKRIKKALASFDEANIFTIHSFSQKMLSENGFSSGFCFDDQENLALPGTYLRLVKDFFRAGLDKKKYSEKQLGIVLKDHQNSVESLAKALSKIAEESFELDLKPFSEKEERPEAIFAEMAKDCKCMIKKALEASDAFSYDDILEKMKEASFSSDFKKAVRASYKAVIVDEFQDTDMTQWSIFKNLFFSNETPCCILYLVGDPKQSIYAFRKADVYTYLAAKEALGEERKAFLDTNFRSSPSLVAALNYLFSDANAPEWLALPKKQAFLPYHPVKAGKEKSAEFPLESPFNDKSPLHFCIAKIEDKKRSFPLEDFEEDFFFPFFAKECLELNQNGFSFKSFAFIVKDRFQQDRLSSYLKRCGIPAALQKPESLKESKAVREIEALIEACLNPKKPSALKIALGGTLFGWKAKDIEHLDQRFSISEIIETFTSLKNTLAEKGFFAFFTAVLNAPRFLDHRSVFEHLASLENGLEFYSELQTLSEAISGGKGRLWDTPEDLLFFLRDLDEYAGEDDFKKAQDLKNDAATIITMHSSKGLEFDVVFPIGLICKTKSPDALIPVDSERGPVLSIAEDLDPSAYQKHIEELDAEKLRQFYVTATRAKHRLYLPAAFAPNAPAPKPPTASPMQLFLSRLGKEKASFEDVYLRMANDDGACLLAFLKNIPPDVNISYSLLEKESLLPTAEAKAVDAPSLKAPDPVAIPEETFFISSFSSLAKSLEDDGEEQKESLLLPKDYSNEEKTPLTLPAGKEIGLLLHRILEKLPFETTLSMEKKELLLPFIFPFVEKTAFAGWEEAIAEVIFNTLKTKLPSENGGFSLAEINKGGLFKETEFLYPSENGFLKGVIDLAFFFDGKYYLADYKSNWLGKSLEDYSGKKLEQAMHEHRYFLQSSIYKDAFCRYLKIVDPRPFDAIFGGVFYIFMRGLDVNNPSSGIYRM